MSTEAARTAGRMTTLPATSKVAMVDPTPAHTETLKATTEDRMTPTEARNRAAMVNRMSTLTAVTNKAAMVDQMTPLGVIEVVVVYPTTNHTGTPRVATDDRITTLTAANKVAMDDPTTNRTKPPRAATDDRMTPTGEPAAVMANRMTKAIVDRKIPTEAPPPVTVDLMITLTEATRRAMVNPTIATSLVPTVDRRNTVLVRGRNRGVRNIC